MPTTRPLPNHRDRRGRRSPRPLCAAPAQADAAARERLAAIDATSGSYGDAFGGYLDQLREDWPE